MIAGVTGVVWCWHGGQGGPHNHTIGGLAVCLKQAATPEFKTYQQQVWLSTQGVARESVSD